MFVLILLSAVLQLELLSRLSTVASQVGVQAIEPNTFRAVSVLRKAKEKEARKEHLQQQEEYHSQFKSESSSSSSSLRGPLSSTFVISGGR
jgi:hypothetical protein